jgi:type VI secretion system ImpM family protein
VLFGKLPAHGDFISRGMSDAERDAWDAWAAGGLAAAEAALGENFEFAHGSAPPWCFVSGPGPLGQGWRVGAFAPSTDRAGRRFIVAAALADMSWGEAAALGVPLSSALTDAIYRMLAEQMNADDALALIAAGAAQNLPPLGEAFAALAEPGGGGVWWTHGTEGFAPGFAMGAAPPADLLLRALTPDVAPAGRVGDQLGGGSV